MGQVLLILMVAAVAAWLVLRQRRQARVRMLLSTPLGDDARELLVREVPLYRRVPASLQPQLQGEINVFLHEKQFVGCRGLEVTDDMRLIVAAQACILLLNRPTGHFPGLRTVLMYADSFVVNKVSHDGPIEINEAQVRAGESWQRGPVVLSWADIEQDLAAMDGHNVVLHEFAHQLDQEDGAIDGAPTLERSADYRDWSRVFSAEYARLQARVERSEPTLIDPYGASEPSEFFAVVTEMFFECPGQLETQHPALYGQMASFFNLDPARW